MILSVAATWGLMSGYDSLTGTRAKSDDRSDTRTLRKQYDDLVLKCNDLNNTAKTQANTIKRLRGSLKAAIGAIGTRDTLVNAKDESIKRLKTQLINSQEENSKIKLSKVLKCTHKISKKKKKIVRKNPQFAKQAKAKIEKEKQVAENNQKIAKLKPKLEKAQKAYDSAKVRYDSAKAKYKRLRNKKKKAAQSAVKKRHKIKMKEYKDEAWEISGEILKLEFQNSRSY